MSYMELHGPYMSWRVDQIQLPWRSSLGCLHHLSNQLGVSSGTNPLEIFKELFYSIDSID
jgi:hypothetical protein